MTTEPALQFKIKDLPVLKEKWNSVEEREENPKKKEEREIQEKREKVWREAVPAKTSDSLSILGRQVMQTWETPLMTELAFQVTQHGGRVLEIGFGMGISAKEVQKFEVAEHVIVEANQYVFEDLEQFAQTTTQKVTPLYGFWQSVLPSLVEREGESFDGILFDDYPISSEQRDDFCNTQLFALSYQLLKKGGILVYYCGETHDFSPPHLSKIRELPWTEVLCCDISVSPPEDCEYWKSPTILAPLLIK